MKLLFAIVFITLTSLDSSYAIDKCTVALRSSENEAIHRELVKAYEYYLKKRNSSFKNLPKEISFRKDSYKVVDFLGGGIDGDVFRVENTSGKRTILKSFRNPLRTFPRQIWDIYKMNKGTKYPYSIIAIDFKRKIIQFNDIRGLPMNEIVDIFEEAGISEQARIRVWQTLAMVGLRYQDNNEIYDIDRGVFVSIDPH